MKKLFYQKLDKYQHIDEFIRKQLSQAEHADEVWNVPPDDVWLKAKAEINAPKKKRRFLWLFFIGLLGLILIGVSFSFLQQEQEGRGDANTQEANVSFQVPESPQSFNAKTDQKAGKKPVAKNRQASTANVPESSAKDISTGVFSLQPEDTSYSEILQSDNSSTQQKSLASVGMEIAEKTTIQPVTIQERTTASDDLSSNNAQDEPKSAIESAEEITDDPTNVLTTLEVLPFTKIRSLIAKTEEPDISLLSSEPQDQNHWKIELGISYSRFFQNPFTDDEEQHRQNNKYLELLSDSYRSTNVVLTSALGRRTSLTTGLYFLQQKIDVAYGLDSLIYDDQNRLIEKEFGDLTAKIAAGTTENDLELIFLPGAEVVNGDTLSLFGNLPIRLRAYQIPLLVNIHLGQRKRLEYLVTAGVSVDIVKLSVDELPIEVYKNNQLVSNDISFQPREVMLLGASLYMGGGLKCHFSPGLNISA
ncbi:MAG: hypothetical protein AAFO69_12355, partial [Bacteroidota bacterium]